MNTKSLQLVILALLVMILLASCGNKPEQNNQQLGSAVNGANTNMNDTTNDSETANEPDVSADDEPVVTETNEAEPEDVQQPINLYYADTDFENLVERQAAASYSNESDKYSTIYALLQQSDDAAVIPLWQHISLLSAKLEADTLTIDVHLEEQGHLGSGGEEMAIQALTRTFFQFDEINNIELLVDGEQAETLMGHVELIHPFTRDSEE